MTCFQAEEDGANVDLDSQRKGKCAVIKTSTRQVQNTCYHQQIYLKCFRFILSCLWLVLRRLSTRHYPMEKVKMISFCLPLYSSLTFCLEHAMRVTSSAILMSEMLFNITVLRNNTSSPNLLAAWCGIYVAADRAVI